MRQRRFMQCDVFTDTPTKGNGLAVVADAEGLSDEQMQSFAAWTNLAETTFLFSPSTPEADYLCRIFTPTREMPFAGHPTLGSCAVWLAAGGTPRDPLRVRQECGVGVVEIDLSDAAPAFVAPPTAISPLPEEMRADICDALAIAPDRIVRTATLENGPVWRVLELKTAADVLAADSSKVKWPRFKAIGLLGAHPEGAPSRYEARMLAPSSGMSEDPITGSLNAALAQWMIAEGRFDGDYVVSQGGAIGRKGRVFVSRAASGDALIGGETHILIDGTVSL